MRRWLLAYRLAAERRRPVLYGRAEGWWLMPRWLIWLTAALVILAIAAALTGHSHTAAQAS